MISARKLLRLKYASRRRIGKSRYADTVRMKFLLKKIEQYMILAGVALILLLLVFFISSKISGKNNPKPDLSNVAAFRISYGSLLALKELGVKYKLPLAELLTVYSFEHDFFPDKTSDLTPSEVEPLFIMRYQQIKSSYKSSATKPYEDMFRSIISEIRAFPIPIDDPDSEQPFIYGDSWGAQRSYEGNRTHEGCDVLDRENIRGRLAVCSMTDGMITNMGWNELGGFRVGITTSAGNYYYYAHLDRYADDLAEGMEIRAGQLLGYMGDTGYGKEGTRGKFQVHLHIGICPNVSFSKKEFWINPYPFLRLIEE